MSESLTAIRRLYAEPPPEAGQQPEMPGPRVEAELAALRPVKLALERLPRQRPPAELIETVIARAQFAEIRSLYGDEVVGPLPPELAAEAVALAPLKAALDRLPAQWPEKAVVDTLVARSVHADVRSLYNEALRPALPPAVARDAAALAPIKAALDRLPRQRPDPRVVDRVVARAAAARRRQAPRGPRRPAWPLHRRLAASFGALAGVVAIGLVTLQLFRAPASEPIVALGPQVEIRDHAGVTPAETRTAEPERAPPPSTGVRLADFAAERRVTPEAGRAHTRRALPAVHQEPDVALASTDFEANQEALRLLYLRLQALSDEWLLDGQAPTVLGAPPVVRPVATHGWMQVRVER